MLMPRLFSPGRANLRQREAWANEILDRLEESEGSVVLPEWYLDKQDRVSKQDKEDAFIESRVRTTVWLQFHKLIHNFP